MNDSATGNNVNKVALITGSAQRLGAQIVETLHRHGFNIVLHYRSSRDAAATLADKLNTSRPNSVITTAANLSEPNDIQRLANTALSAWGRLDALINNASSFYPNAITGGDTTLMVQQWDDLFNSNLRSAFLLSTLTAESLQKNRGCIINITDIHADRPLQGHSIYCASKAGLASLTRSLAKELAPAVRVNGVAPGAILWPQDAAEMSETEKAALLAEIPLQCLGDPDDIANAVLFLIDKAHYITGQIIAVDGGRSL